MHLCYLACQATLPGSLTRRVDAYEHDQMMENLRAAFEAKGGRVTAVSWDDPAADWSLYDAVMIGTTWDYHDRLDDFLAVLAEIETKTKLFNSRSLVEWNCHKRYLKDLSERGIATIPTLWADDATPAVVASAFDQFGCDTLVAKRQVGAGGEGQHRLERGQPVPDMPSPMKIQPFMENILKEGEISFIFIGGKYVFALLKTAAEGEYRIQSCYGGQEQVITPVAADIVAASKAVAALDEVPLYARVDMLRGTDGELLLMELELIEPFLYPVQGPELGARVFEALGDLL
ncbi:ATP-grasp domain-containing protein [Kordiimonas sp.]|uniref:ATP-grasp domain-containing protein n=1 Tax=Kordiimonas sp. TaxID=1970157 RepID=UPI003A90C420